ncbi:hypothetical protein DIPPA_23375 [Diplonema papillatum]|nr:hypothetical protein DIPPA_23375 [Diplonema papillatum]
MDVFVTSRHKAVPCLEWSKQTSRQDPVIGVGDTGYNAVLKRAREDPWLRRHTRT